MRNRWHLLAGAYVLAVTLWEGGAFAADERVWLTYKMEENLSYRAEHEVTILERHEDDRVTYMKESLLFRNGPLKTSRAGNMARTPSVNVLRRKWDAPRGDYNTLWPIPSFRRVYPWGRLTKHADGDEGRGRVWSLDEVLMFAGPGPFPVLPDTPVQPGDSWRTFVTVCADRTESVFDLTVKHILRGVDDVDGVPCAIIDYTIEGELDTREHMEMQTAEGEAWLCRVSGQGTASIDIARGQQVKVTQEATIARKEIVDGDEVRDGAARPSSCAFDEIIRHTMSVERVDEKTADRLAEQEPVLVDLNKAKQPEGGPHWMYSAVREHLIDDRLVGKEESFIDRMVVGYGAGYGYGEDGKRKGFLFVDDNGHPLAEQYVSRPLGGLGLGDVRRMAPIDITRPEVGPHLPDPSGSEGSVEGDMLQNRLCILPITNGGALNVGAEWYVKLPVAPTMSGKFSMPVSVVHRVTAVKEVRGRRCAAIEYHLQLRLSPLEQPDMFQDFLAGPFFFDYKLEGGGTAWVDLEEGIVVEKTQEFTMTKFAKLRRAPGDGEDAWQVRENVESRTRWKVTLDSARD